MQLDALLRHIAQDFRRQLERRIAARKEYRRVDLAFRFRQRLALLRGDQRRQRVDVGEHSLDDGLTLALRATIKTHSGIGAREFVRCGAGIALLPDYAVDDDIARGDLVRVLPAWNEAHSRPISAVFPSRDRLATRVRLLIDFLRDSLSEGLPAAVVQERLDNQHSEGNMSADKDRGIRRQKQKRAKQRKKRALPQQPAGVAPGSAPHPAKQQVA